MAKTDSRKPVLPKSLAGGAKSGNLEKDTDSGQTIINKDKLFLSRRLADIRSEPNVVKQLRQLVKIDGTFSSAVFNMVQVADSGLTLSAYTTGTHEYSPQGVQAAETVVAGLDTLFDYTKGFSFKRTLRATSQTMLRETALTGAPAAELVLDKQRLPSYIQVVDYSSLEWVSDGKGGKYPQQQVAGGSPIALKIPTFFVSESHLQADSAYALSMFRSAVDTTFHFIEFIQDLRSVVHKSGHSRLVCSLDAAKVRASAPQEFQMDEGKMATYMAEVKAQVEDSLKSLSPEEAVVAYDSVGFQTHDIGGVKSDYPPLLEALSGMYATALKSSPSVLGMRIGGSQSLSNTESLVYLKIAKSLQGPVEDILSRMLTLAIRLYGVDAYVKVRFNSINLRPDDELEAFKTMKQDRILKQLSLGFITDEEASRLLGLTYNTAMPKLSGTMFMDMKGGVNAEDASPNDDPMGRALQSDSPKKAGGKSQ